MKVASVGVIIYCLIGIAAPAQTVEEQQLADFAREERQRREARGVAAEGVVTSENVRRGLGLRGFIGRVGMVVPGAPSEAAQSGATDAGEAPEPGVEADAGVSDDPLEALRRQQQVVQALQAEEVRIQLEINRLRAQFQAPVISQRERDEASRGMTDAGAELETLRFELAEAIEVLLSLQAAAAAAEVP